MSFVMFWSSECLLMGVICFLPLPCSLPASPTPILLYLHAVPPVPHLPPQLPCPLLVCSDTAPSTEPAAHGWYLYFPPYVSLALSFFFNLYICLCSMPAFTVTHQTLLCQAAQPGNVSFVLCVRFMLAILKQVPVRLHFTLIAVMLSNIYKNPSNSSYFSCTCKMVSPTNQLQCFPEGATEEYHPH